MRLPTSGRSRSLKSWLQRSAPVRFPPASFCRRKASSRRCIRTMRTPSLATWTRGYSSAARSRRHSRSCLRRLGKKRLIHSTPARVEGVKRHIRSITRNSARSLPAWMSWQFWMAASASSSFAACARSCLRNMTSPSIRITNTSRMPTGATRLILKSFYPPSSK